MESERFLLVHSWQNINSLFKALADHTNFADFFSSVKFV